MVSFENRREFLVDGLVGLFGLGTRDLSAEMASDSVPRLDELRGRGERPGTILFVEGYHEPQDGGGGIFIRATSAETNEGLLHPRAEDALWVEGAGEGGPWIRVVSQNDAVNVKWFGARADGTSDAAEAINDAIFLSGHLGVRRTYIPAGTYRLDMPIILGGTFGHTLTGDGPVSTVLEKKRGGTATTSLSEEPIDAAIIIPVLVREKSNGEQRTITPHSTTVRDMRIRGKEAGTHTPFERDHGIYVERTSRASFENLIINKFDRAFFAHQIFMSRLVRLWSKHIRNFIDISSAPARHEIAGPRTSLTIQNCYCSNDVRGDGFKLRVVTYSTLQNCGADRVEGTPYDIHACRGVNLIGCGFERSSSGRGIRFRGSNGTIIGARTYHPEVPEDTEEPRSLLEVTTLDWGRTSSVTIIGSDFADYEKSSDDRSSESSGDPIAPNLFDRIVDPESTLTVIGTQFPKNARPLESMDSTRRGKVVELTEEGDEAVLDPQRARELSEDVVDRSAGKATGKLEAITGTDADQTLNDNFATLNAKIDRILEALTAK